jgi:hypothetical protein
MLKKQAVEQLWRAREIATHVEPEEAIEAKTQEEARPPRSSLLRQRTVPT